MKIGVKFCGGCNPRYDRKAYYLRVIDAYPQHTFSIADETDIYDYLLVIGGCSSCCASHSQYQYSHLIKVWDAGEILNLPAQA